MENDKHGNTKKVLTGKNTQKDNDINIKTPTEKPERHITRMTDRQGVREIKTRLIGKHAN